MHILDHDPISVTAVRERRRDMHPRIRSRARDSGLPREYNLSVRPQPIEIPAEFMLGEDAGADAIYH